MQQSSRTFSCPPVPSAENVDEAFAVTIRSERQQWALAAELEGTVCQAVAGKPVGPLRVKACRSEFVGSTPEYPR
jgi:hypothetical protein